MGRRKEGEGRKGVSWGGSGKIGLRYGFDSKCLLQCWVDSLFPLEKEGPQVLCATHCWVLDETDWIQQGTQQIRSLSAWVSESGGEDRHFVNNHIKNTHK